MGRDKQEQKIKERRLVESDRDQKLNNKGATILEGPEEARERNRG